MSTKELAKARRRLLPYEVALVESGQLKEVTYPRAHALWFSADSTVIEDEKAWTVVYRPMGDDEISHLVQHNQLPSTQPYQAIIEGPAGRIYAEKYLKGAKRVDTTPRTVVEFLCPKHLIEELFNMQHKVEDGVLSMGLGFKAGRGLPRFNQSLENGTTTWRIVFLKRP